MIKMNMKKKFFNSDWFFLKQEKTISYMKIRKEKNEHSKRGNLKTNTHMNKCSSLLILRYTNLKKNETL